MLSRWSGVGVSGGTTALRSRGWASLVAAALAAAIGGGACAQVSGSDPHEGSGPVGTPDAAVGWSPPDVQVPVDPPGALRGRHGAGCQTARCGNGVVEVPTEMCDDGNSFGGDGCSPDCKIETDWICTTPGQPCTSTVACGDGLVTGLETCDDRNKLSGDGCSADCGLEPGWRCPAMGARCIPVCGDGRVMGFRDLRRRQLPRRGWLQRWLPD